MATLSVFVSSVVKDFEQVRAAAAEGVEAVGCHPVLSETSAASVDPSRRALFDEIASADIYLLLLGSRYGDKTKSGLSPTEDEYEEAVRLSRPIIVLVQDCDMEPEQRAFLERVRGSWGTGVFYGSFTDHTDVALKVAGAISKYRSGELEDGPSAQQRVLELVRDDELRTGSGTLGVVGMVPLRSTQVLDSLALEDSALGDQLSALLRDAGVVPQTVGIAATISAKGVVLQGSESASWVRPGAVVGSDGSILVVASIQAENSSGLAFVDPTLLKNLIKSAGNFAQETWSVIDKRNEVGNVALAVAIPSAQYVAFGRPTGNTVHIGHGLTPTVVAPDPAIISPRGDLSGEHLSDAVAAAVKRVFADAGAVQ